MIRSLNVCLVIPGNVLFLNILGLHASKERKVKMYFCGQQALAK